MLSYNMDMVHSMADASRPSLNFPAVEGSIKLHSLARTLQESITYTLAWQVIFHLQAYESKHHPFTTTNKPAIKYLVYQDKLTKMKSLTAPLESVPVRMPGTEPWCLSLLLLFQEPVHALKHPCCLSFTCPCHYVPVPPMDSSSCTPVPQPNATAVAPHYKGTPEQLLRPHRS